MRQRSRGSRGFTLAELLVVLAIIGMVVALLATLFQQGQQTFLAGAGQVEAQQSARVALERMAGELRAAGYDPTGAGFLPLVNPTSTSFTIQNDLNGDGVIAGNPERITYLLRGRTLRRSAGGGAQPMIEGVESLTFTYLDAAGNPTAIPGEIRAIRIAITTTTTTGANAVGAGRVSMTTEVRLRNR